MTLDPFEADLKDLFPSSPATQAQVRKVANEIRQPLGPGDPRRHHFLPQFFLKRFATDDGRIAVVELDAPDRPTVTTVANAAVMKDLYTVVDDKIGERPWSRSSSPSPMRRPSSRSTS